MSTRAASATLSLRAKQDLVRVLFGAELCKKGPKSHSLLDHSIYSYADLRSAYLERIQKLHPDKQRSQQPASLKAPQRRGVEDNSQVITDASRFAELQEAWNRYELIAKVSKRVGKGEGRDVDTNFTMFGVGCSFSDTEEEREKRAKIMDEASRGWFSAGVIGHDSDERIEASDTRRAARGTVPLACDKLFEPRDNDDARHNETSRVQGDTTAVESTSSRIIQRSLVSHLIPPHRR